MPTLLQIGDEVQALVQLLDEAAEANEGGELSEEQSAAFDKWFQEIGAKREDKIDAYCGLIREMDLRAAARREEMERLALRVRVDENQARALKLRLKDHFIATGEKKVETRRFKVWVQNNGGKQPLELHPMLDPNKLPTELQKVTISPDLDKIREALADGCEVPGCRLLPRGTQLRIQ